MKNAYHKVHDDPAAVDESAYCQVSLAGVPLYTLEWLAHLKKSQPNACRRLQRSRVDFIFIITVHQRVLYKLRTVYLAVYQRSSLKINRPDFSKEKSTR